MIADSIKIMGIGSPILDLLVNVDDNFISQYAGGEKGGMELVNAMHLDSIINETQDQPLLTAPGGSAANTIFGLAKLGMKTSFLGKIGNDIDGATYKKIYEEMGGDTSNFTVAETSHTARCLSLVTPDSERTMRTDLGAAATLSYKDVTPENFVDITHLHIEGYLLFTDNLFEHILTTAKSAGCVISMDLSSFEVVNIFKDSLPNLLKNYVDIIFANEDEANALCGNISVEKQADILSEYCNTSVIKLGKKGAFIKHKAQTYEIEAKEVTAVDTTGAGDLWQAGFLYGLLNRKNIPTAGSYGSILGASVVQIMGASIPDIIWDDIQKELKSS